MPLVAAEGAAGELDLIRISLSLSAEALRLGWPAAAAARCHKRMGERE